MPVELKINASKRTDVGKGASRRLRHAKKLPAVLYGGDEGAISLTVDALQVQRLLEEEAFYSQILTLDIDGQEQNAVLKDLQRHPFKPVVLHMDLQRVRAGQKMQSHIPLHFTGEEIAVKREGGMLHHDVIEVMIECLPRNLPKFIEVDVSGLKIGDALHLSDLNLPEGVIIPELEQGEEHNLPVVSMRGLRVTKDTDGADSDVEPESGSEDAD